jgi:hypothetical protein
MINAASDFTSMEVSFRDENARALVPHSSWMVRDIF